MSQVSAPARTCAEEEEGEAALEGMAACAADPV